MASLSTHILDTSRGRPAAGVAVALQKADGSPIAEADTDDDGRVAALGADLDPGTYVLRFATGAYLGEAAFYPEVTVTFTVGADEHYHVPLLLNPYGYSTYRGS
jgi:5-hydroxyisourate hydrolase